MSLVPHDDEPRAPADPALIRGLRAAMSAQRPAVLAHIRSIRRQHPTASPEQAVRILEKRFLASVTLSGAGSGGASVIPGVGTAITLTVIGAETVLFFEMTALFAQSVAEIHGIVVDDEERAHTLVMALLLGGPGKELLEQFLRQAGTRSGDRSEYWGETITATMPKAVTSYLNRALREQLAKRFAVAQGAHPATLQGLAGLGDLIATCQSPLSRNNTAGRLLGQGYSFQDVVKQMEQTAEGLASVAPVLALAAEAGIDMPIVEQVKMVLDGTMNPRDIAPHLTTDDDEPQGERTQNGTGDGGGAVWRSLQRALDQLRHGGRGAAGTRP